MFAFLTTIKDDVEALFLKVKGATAAAVIDVEKLVAAEKVWLTSLNGADFSISDAFKAGAAFAQSHLSELAHEASALASDATGAATAATAVASVATEGADLAGQVAGTAETPAA